MRRTTLTALIVSLFLVLSACGDDDDNDATLDATTTTEADTPAEDTPDPDTTEAATDADGAVRQFMDARVDGTGAEAYLTDEATDVYPDEIALYDVATYEIDAVEQADASSYEVTVDVTDDQGATRTEMIFVGPGATTDGTSIPFAIRGAVRS